MQEHPKFLCIPHLGASTGTLGRETTGAPRWRRKPATHPCAPRIVCAAEAEDNCAYMAADQIIKFLELGQVVNSVNFPTAVLDRQAHPAPPALPLTPPPPPPNARPSP